MFSFFTGRKFSNTIAVYIGVDKALYSSALLEAGTTWAHLKMYKQAGLSMEEVANILMPTFIHGLTIIKGRFGPQQTIIKAEAVVWEWARENGYMDEDATQGDSDMKAPTGGPTSPVSEDCIISSEFPSGRYRLSCLVQTNETVRGEQIGNEIIFVYLSDDLEALEGLALVKSLGGIEVNLIDTETGEAIPKN